MTPSGTLTGLGARAGYPQIVVPAGYGANDRRPVGIAFNGTAYSEEKLLAFAYAYEQATKLRRTPSEINPADVALLRRRAALLPARQGARHRRPARLPARDRDGAGAAGQADRGHAERGHADQGLHAADRRHQHRRARRSTPSARSTRRRSRRPPRPTPSAPPAPSAARCTASPCWSRTTSTPPACRRRRAASRSSTRSRTRDSPVVAKLRAAGAILLGKLNLSEFANFLTNGMPSGYSSLGGQVLNPYNADITPCGSSLRLRRRGGRRPGGDHDRHRDQRLDREPVGGAGDRRAAAHDRPRVADRHPADQRHAGHRRADDPDGRRRGRRARRDRRQGPGGPGHRLRARDGPELPRGRSARPRWPASGSASSTTPTRSTSPRSPPSRRWARRR